jgi:hypothetical protein
VQSPSSDPYPFNPHNSKAQPLIPSQYKVTQRVSPFITCQTSTIKGLTHNH